MIEPPLWLVILPLVAAPPVYLLRRWGIGAYLAAATALLTGLLAWSFPPTLPFRLMGRPFFLDPLTQHVLALLSAMAAVLFLLAWRLPQGRSLFPFGLIGLGLLAGAGMSRHLGISALLMTLAAISSVPLIQGEQRGAIRAPWRLLAMMLLALPFFLLAAWRVDLYREDVENAVYLGQAALFLALGMWIWLAVVPWHGWLTAVGAGAPPLAAAFVLTSFPLLALVNLSQVLTEATWFTWAEEAQQLLLTAGLASAAIGGVLAAVQRGFRPLLGYAALFDLGGLLVAMAVGGPLLGQAAPTLPFAAGLVVRALALTLTGAATAAIHLWTGKESFAGLQGAARQWPLATAALTLGGFTLAGLPLTAGFLPRWLLVRNLAQTDPRWSWLLMAAALGVAVGYLRGLSAMLASPAGGNRDHRHEPHRLATAFLLTLALLTLGLGLFPDLLLRLAHP